jgi:hypothetical protein
VVSRVHTYVSTGADEAQAGSPMWGERAGVKGKRAMRAVLIGSSGLVLGREYALDAPVVTIGRRDENTIVIKDPTVSRKHAEIYRDGESLFIVDKGSTSGITVNGQLISGQQPLRDGDRIGIGSSAVFLIQLQPAEDKTIAFSQHDLSEQGKTQFITREMGDPRAMPSAPGGPPPSMQDNRRPSEPQIPNAPPPPMAPASPRQEPVSPPPASPSFSAPPPSFAPPSSAPSWNDPPRQEPPAPDFAPPRPSVDLGGAPFSPPTMPDMPRSHPELGAPGMGQPPLAPDFGPPRFDSPPPPGGNFPPVSAVSEFAPNNPSSPSNPNIGGAPPQFGAPPPSFSSPPPPSFASPPPPAGQPPMPMQMGQQQFGANAPGPMMSPPPPPAAPARGGRMGLIIALIVVIILVVIAAVVVGLLLTGRLG